MAMLNEGAAKITLEMRGEIPLAAKSLTLVQGYPGEEIEAQTLGGREASFGGLNTFSRGEQTPKWMMFSFHS